MSEQQEQKPRYMVSVYDDQASPGTLIFTFVPKGLQAARGTGGPPPRVPQYILLVKQQGTDVTFSWRQTSDDPGGNKDELQNEALARLKARNSWIQLVRGLIVEVENWAKQSGWATKVIEKKLVDSYIGTHTVPALLMQEDTLRVLLEPVARAAPRGESVVDLYLMPAYDDIASLYYREGRWHLHYVFPNQISASNLREAMAKPLSKEALFEVLSEMKKHA